MYQNVRIIENATVTQSGAYYESGGLIEGTQRIPTTHIMEYWQGSNLELTVSIPPSYNVTPNHGTALYVGRIPTHFGHLIIEGLSRLCYAAKYDMPIVGYLTDGTLPAGLRNTPRQDVEWLVKSITPQSFIRVEKDQFCKVEKLYVPEQPMTLSYSVKYPDAFTDCIFNIVQSARQLHREIKVFNNLYLLRDGETGTEDFENFVINDPFSPLSKQIALVSHAQSLYGNTGSNTHLSIFAGKNTGTAWTYRTDYDQTNRNQLMCDLIKTFNIH